MPFQTLQAIAEALLKRMFWNGNDLLAHKWFTIQGVQVFSHKRETRLHIDTGLKFALVSKIDNVEIAKNS